jgi:hypothetical protein
VIGAAAVGCLDTDLGRAVQRALAVPAASCRAYAMGFTWRESARQFAAIATAA